MSATKGMHVIKGAFKLQDDFAVVCHKGLPSSDQQCCTAVALGTTVSHLQRGVTAPASALPVLPRFLSLAGNRIRKVENLRPLQHLRFLDLSQNQIQTLDAGGVAPAEPWPCPCTLQHLGPSRTPAQPSWGWGVRLSRALGAPQVALSEPFP